jgi:hypothetical protein
MDVVLVLLVLLDDFAHRAHVPSLAETFSDRKRQRDCG